MEDLPMERRTGCKRARRATTVSMAMRAVLVVLLAAPHVPSCEALKLASISEERGHLGVGLLRAVEVVRGRYERAWALVSASEPTAEDLDTALELLQANAKQWESLEPAVKLWTERENEATRPNSAGNSKTTESTTKSPKHASEQHYRSSTGAAEAADGTGGQQQQQQQEERAPGAPGASDTTSRIYEEAASLLAHNRAVLGQALARSGHADRGIAELEVACPDILEYQQNAQGRRDSKSWLHCYANLADMYKTQKRFEEASSLLARMPWLPSPQGITTTDSESASQTPSDESPTAGDSGVDDGSDILAVPLGTGQAVAAGADIPEDGSSSGAEATADGESAGVSLHPSDKNQEEQQSSGDVGGAEDPSTPGSPTPSKGGGGGRSDAPPPRGAGAARVAGLNKAAAAAAAAAAAESAAAAAGAVETGAEAAARAVVERHAEAMRASMNELVGELAVTTATRPSASQDWLNSRVVAAEEVLAAVRSGLLSVAATPEQTTGGGGDSAADTVADVPTMVVGAPGHADILREASHYLSAIKGVAAQGWAYVDNELYRMERHPAQAVKPGFQSRREVIHTFRYLLMKARQYASENQSQSSRTMASGAASSQAGSGSGSRWRRKDSRGGRKASSSSKAPRKGSAARGKSSARSDADSSSAENDGLLTLFIGAGIALLVAAVSSGGGKGQGRRREAERQRTATRAAKTVGSYVEPPQRTAVAALMVHLWGNLKRSGLVVSSHAISTANLSRTLLFTAWASLFERIRAARASARSSRAIGAGKATASSSFKKTAGGAQSNGTHKQRSKKNVKKTAAAPSRLLVRGDTAMVTPPASPPAAAIQAAAQQKFAAVGAADVAESAPVEIPGTDSTAPSDHKAGTIAPLRKSAKTVTTNGVAASGSADVPRRAPAVAPATGPAASVATAAVQAAAEKSAGVPFPDVMTAEQVQAMVEEDERAWEQARLSEKLHSRAAAAAAASPSSASVAAATAIEVELEDAGGGAGWSEVGGASSRGRASGGGGARGRVLSIRNVRAAAQAARTSSPGSDPATTTSASSSDSSEGCKEKSSLVQAMETRGGGRVAGRQGGRAVQGTTRGTTTLPRSGTKPAWGGVPSQARGGDVRAEQARRAASGARDSDQAVPRAARAPHASRSASRSAAATPPVSANGKPRSVAGVPQKKSTAGGVDRASVAKGVSASALKPVPVWAAAAAAAAVAPVVRTQAVSASLRQQPLHYVVSASEGLEKEADVKSAEDEAPQAAPAQPAAWTNTPSHPLGMQPEPAPLPPASEPPCPPPQHQQHWQRQQQREQHQQRQHQHHHQHHHQQQQHHHHQQHQHFFHQQEPPLMAMPAAPVPPHQHDASHHYPPLSSLAPQAHHHGPPQQQHEVIMPQYIPPSDEAFPPPSGLMPIPAGAASATATATAAMASFPIHPAHVPTLPSSPGGGLVAGVHPHFHARDGSFDSPGSAGVAFSLDAAVLAPPQAMVLPPPYDQQQQQQQQPGRFSPPTLQVVPVEEIGSGGGVVSPMYGQQGQGPSSSGGGFLANANVGGGSDGGEAFEALINALRWQVEYYFSADNLVTDSYLRGLMDPEGFVAVSKIIVFNRVRSMTSDPSLVIAAMRRSNELEILEQDHTGETRVRTRHSPLHWTREQLPPVNAPSPPSPQEDQHQEGERYEQEEVAAVEEEEEEEEEHHITFGNVAEVIGLDDSPPVSVSVERGQTDSRD